MILCKNYTYLVHLSIAFYHDILHMAVEQLGNPSIRTVLRNVFHDHVNHHEICHQVVIQNDEIVLVHDYVWSLHYRH